MRRRCGEPPLAVAPDAFSRPRRSGRGVGLEERERPGQQQRGAGVGLPERVQRLGGHVQDGAVPTAPGVVAHEDVQRPGELARGIDERLDPSGVPQVRAHLPQPRTLGEFGPQCVHDVAQIVRAPWLALVVRAVVVDEYTRAQPREGAGNGEADAAAS